MSRPSRFLDMTVCVFFVIIFFFKAGLRAGVECTLEGGCTALEDNDIDSIVVVVVVF